jgi:hypothetical protein
LRPTGGCKENNEAEKSRVNQLLDQGRMLEMKSLADAIVYAVVYIDLRDDPGEEFLDADVGALESIGYYLHQATEAEKDALAEAAERALAQEKASDRPREEFVEAYQTWMEVMFGDDDWRGNKRKSETSKGTS